MLWECRRDRVGGREAALKALLRRLIATATDLCNKNNIHITTIGFSIPAQWDKTAEEYLRRKIVKIFKIGPDVRLLCYYEIDGLVRFYLDDDVTRQTILGQHIRRLGNAHVLIVDAGGYSMVR